MFRSVGLLVTFMLAVAPSAFGGEKQEVRKIAIKAMAFTPATLVVKAGETVEWTNEDIVPHTVTGEGFDSGAITSGQTWRRTFKAAGAVSYKCLFHPSMVASLTVK